MMTNAPTGTRASRSMAGIKTDFSNLRCLTIQNPDRLSLDVIGLGAFKETKCACRKMRANVRMCGKFARMQDTGGREREKKHEMSKPINK